MELFPWEAKSPKQRYLNPEQSRLETVKQFVELLKKFPELQAIPREPLRLDTTIAKTLPKTLVDAFLDTSKLKLVTLTKSSDVSYVENGKNNLSYLESYDILQQRLLARAVNPTDITNLFSDQFKDVKNQSDENIHFVGPDNNYVTENLYKQLFFTPSGRYGTQTLADLLINTSKACNNIADNCELVVDVDVMIQLKEKIRFFGFSQEEQKRFNMLLLNNSIPLTVAEELLRTMNQKRTTLNLAHATLLMHLIDAKQIAQDWDSKVSDFRSEVAKLPVTSVEKFKQEWTEEFARSTNISPMTHAQILDTIEHSFDDLLQESITDVVPSKSRITMRPIRNEQSELVEDTIFDIAEVEELPVLESQPIVEKIEIQVDVGRYTYAQMTQVELERAYEFGLTRHYSIRQISLANLDSNKQLSVSSEEFIKKFTLDPNQYLQEVERFVFQSPELTSNLKSFIMFVQSLKPALAKEGDFSMMLEGIEGALDHLMMAEETSNLFLAQYYVSKMDSLKWIKNCALKVVKTMKEVFNKNP